MPDENRPGLLHLHEDYEIERWTTGDTDAEGHLIWNRTEPKDSEWDRITMVTLDYDPEGEGAFRNIPIPAKRPLDPYASDSPEYEGPHKGGRYGPDYYYDIDDLATNFDWSQFSP